MRGADRRAARRAVATLGVIAAAMLAGLAASAARADPPAARRVASAAGPAAPSAAVQRHLQWLLRTGDHEGRVFGILDKRDARLWLFDEQAKAVASTPVLLGSARGDASVSGIGERPLEAVLPHERTTPAGRFLVESGRNTLGEDVFWIDYDAAVSMHRVRATQPAERRLERLATPSPADNRISYGCVNVPTAFFEQRLKPHLKGRRAVMYVLPEALPATQLFTPVRSERRDLHSPAAWATPLHRRSS